MRLLLSSILLATALSAPAARADQCALNPVSVGQAAGKLVKPGATVLEFCEPCGDKAPGQPYKVTSVSFQQGQLAVNAKTVDLAYLYVETGAGEFRNVGIAANCIASDVSEWIRNGKPSGRVARGPWRTPNAPPPPPMPPKVQSPDDIMGTWNVRITTRYSSCPGVLATGHEQVQWTIAATPTGAELATPDGILDGTLDPQHGYGFKTTLRPKKHPSSQAAILSFYFKDSFGGQLVRAQRNASAKDPICIIQQEVFAKRVP
jgi:hypothetical protein